MRKREILGLVLLLVGASGIFLSAKDSAPQNVYLTAKRDISPGEIVKKGDFREISLYLADSAGEYIGAEINLDSHRSLRKIKSGEIVPRDAISGATESESRRLVTFNVESSKIPPNLKEGSLIDLYFFSRPDLGTSSSQIELVESFLYLRIHEITLPTVQLDGNTLISVLVDEMDVARLLQLISTCAISISQRFDDE